MTDPNTPQGHPDPAMIRFRCPSCHIELQMPTEYAGKQARCSQCKTVLEVPAAPPAAQPASDKITCICGACKGVFQTDAHPLQQNCPKCGAGFDLPHKEGVASPSQMFRFRCQSCGQRYAVLAKYGGKKIKCLTCQRPLPIPLPPRPKSGVIQLKQPQLDILEEIPEQEPHGAESSYNLADIPEGPALGIERDFEPAVRPPRKEGGTSLASKLKVPLIAAACIIGFIAGFIGIRTFTSKEASPQADALPVQSPRAIEFADQTIRKLAAKDIEDITAWFDGATEELTVATLARMLNSGTLDRIDSEVTYSNIQTGAEAYRVHSNVFYTDGTERAVDMGFGFYETWDDWEEQDITGTTLMTIQLSRPNGSVMYTAGTEDLDALTTDLAAFVDQNSTLELPTSWICTILIVFLIIGLVSVIAQISVFTDAGEPGWAVFIPVYREVCLARIADKSEGLGWFCGLSGFIPYVGNLIYIVLVSMFSIGIARNYGRGVLFGLGLAFLPFIFYPVLAFSNNR